MDVLLIMGLVARNPVFGGLQTTNMFLKGYPLETKTAPKN